MRGRLDRVGLVVLAIAAGCSGSYRTLIPGGSAEEPEPAPEWTVSAAPTPAAGPMLAATPAMSPAPVATPAASPAQTPLAAAAPVETALPAAPPPPPVEPPRPPLAEPPAASPPMPSFGGLPASPVASEAPPVPPPPPVAPPPPPGAVPPSPAGAAEAPAAVSAAVPLAGETIQIIEFDVTNAQITDYDGVTRTIGMEVAETIATELRRRGLNAQATPLSAPRTAPLIVDGKITELDGGSRLKRAFTGFAGGVRLGVQVTVSRAYGAAIGQLVEEERASFGLFGGNDSELLQRCIDDLGQDVAERIANGRYG
ncbi:MAG: hypothetical protein QOD06_752 [Candidatus Binatota bacterium]|nr:hypothetical protein [Candidatus Binatota bacterium]